ncbi:MAG: hypothetical protein E7016_04005 [Alphaproteobacteria bacterium]|nr:hypothetical protein [Alphaproteobacteria bacterium]
MNENQNSTPLSEDINDTLSSNNVDDTLSTDEPDTFDDKPEVSTDEAENTTTEDLIFGKFKTLEEAHKGYKEAQKAITKSAELEKQIKLYQEEAKNYEQDKIAREKGFSSYYAMALDDDVWHHEVNNYALAARHMLSPQECLKVNALVEQCHKTRSDIDLAMLRRYFNPEVVALVSQDTAIFKNNRLSEYQKMSINDKNLRYNRKLDEFRQVNTNWLDSSVKKDLVAQALEISDGNVDLIGLKSLVEQIEQDAISKYRKDKNTQQENSQMQNSLVEPSGNNMPKTKKKKWLTKDEYYKLSPKEEAEKYDLIVEQVKLEKAGRLPRMLT